MKTNSNNYEEDDIFCALNLLINGNHCLIQPSGIYILPSLSFCYYQCDFFWIVRVFNFVSLFDDENSGKSVCFSVSVFLCDFYPPTVSVLVFGIFPIMAVAENGVASGAQHFETTDLERSNGNHVNNNEKSEKTKDQGFSLKNNQNHNHNHNNNIVNGTDSHKPQLNGADDEKNDGFEENHGLTKSGTENGTVDDDNNIKEKNNNLTNGEGLKKEIRDLEEMLSKLNPMAKEFVPPSLVSYGSFGLGGKNNFGYVNNFLIQQPNAGGNVNEFPGRRVSEFVSLYFDNIVNC